MWSLCLTLLFLSVCVRVCAAVVLYASNVLGSRGPRKMQVCIPQVRPEDDSIMHWRESKDRCAHPRAFTGLGHNREGAVTLRAEASDASN